MQFNSKFSNHSKSMADTRYEDSIIEQAKRDKAYSSKAPRNLHISLSKVMHDWQLSSRKLTKELIAKLVKMNKAKASMTQGYVSQMQKLDAVFTKIKKEEASDQVEEIIQTIDRVEEKTKELTIKKNELQDQVERVSIDMQQDQHYLMAGLARISSYREDEKSKLVSDKLRHRHIANNLTLYPRLTRTSQRHATAAVDLEGIDRHLQQQYLDWIDTKVCGRLKPPVQKSDLAIRQPAREALLGYFEQMILKIVGYKATEEKRKRMERIDEQSEDNGNASSRNREAILPSSSVPGHLFSHAASGGLDSNPGTGAFDAGTNISKANASSLFKNLNEHVKPA